MPITQTLGALSYLLDMGVESITINPVVGGWCLSWKEPGMTLQVAASWAEFTAMVPRARR